MPYHPCMACLPIHLVGLHGKCRYRYYISDMDPMGQNLTKMAGGMIQQFVKTDALDSLMFKSTETTKLHSPSRAAGFCQLATSNDIFHLVPVDQGLTLF